MAIPRDRLAERSFGRFLVDPVGEQLRRRQRTQLRLGPDTRPFSAPSLPPRSAPPQELPESQTSFVADRCRSVGELLRTRREYLGHTVVQVVDATRLPRRALEALEQDNFDEIAGAFYVRGFLRVYAGYLKLEPEIVLERYENQVAIAPVYEDEPVAEVPDYFRTKRSKVRSLSPAQLFLLLITAATLVVFMLSINRQRVHDKVASRPGVTAPGTPATATIGPVGRHDGAASTSADAGPR